MSSSVLNRLGFRLVSEIYKFTLFKGGIIMGKGYMCKGMFKLKIIIRIKLLFLLTSLNLLIYDIII